MPRFGTTSIPTHSRARCVRLLAGLVITLTAWAGSPAVAQAVGPGPTLTCSSDASFFSTGYNGTGGKLSPGVPDAHWEAGLGDATGPASVAT